MRQKGLSPLIAVVLLIAFTISVGVIIGAWVTSFSKSKTEELGTTGGKAVSCSGGVLDFKADNIGSTSIQIENKGNIDLYDFRIVVVNSTAATEYNTTNYNKTNPLKPGNPGVVSNSALSASSGDTVRVVAGNCPEVNDQEKKP
jgi:flagellin-like protein